MIDVELSRLTEILIPMWQRVLRRSQIGVDENFFDLGGDFSSAFKLFAEIAQVTGRELPPVTICQAPTIAGLAALLESKNPVRFPSLIQLKAGGARPAVFITHGTGSSVLELSQLLRHIQTDHPIYGLQGRGMDGVDQPFDRIEDMAQSFLDGVRKMQPTGPYILIGYSMGGLVTLEMAQRLSEIGEKTALLAMIESFPARQFMPTSQRMSIYFRLLRKKLMNVRQLPLRDAIPYILRPSERIERMPQVHGASPTERPSSHFAPIMQRVRDAGYRALTHYRPRYYSGKINFVKAEISMGFPDNATAVWADLAAELVVDTVPGDHFGVITAHSECLGSLLSRYLYEALH